MRPVGARQTRGRPGGRLRAHRRRGGARRARQGSPELKWAKQGYRSAFGEAFRQALSELPAADLRLMRYRFADQLKMRDVASIYRVNHTTIERAKAGLLGRTRELFGDRLGVGDTECQSIIRLIQSDFAVTMQTFFGSGSSRRNDEER